MNKQELSKLLLTMMNLYGRQYPDPETAIRAIGPSWHMVMSDIDYRDASAGLMWFARSDKKGFPPSPGQIIDCIDKAREAANPGNHLDEGQAWSLVYRALRDSIYHAEEQFERLPPLIRRAIGSPSGLTQMAIQEGDVSVIRGQFARSYREVIERERREQDMPQPMREMAEQARMALDESMKPKPVSYASYFLTDGREYPFGENDG